jgi:hypothetical protein
VVLGVVALSAYRRYTGGMTAALLLAAPAALVFLLFGLIAWVTA